MASQKLPGPHSGIKQTMTPGDPLARSMGHYGKKGDPSMADGAAGLAGLPSAVDEHPGGPAFKGGKGGMKDHPRDGGIDNAGTAPGPGFGGVPAG